MRDSSLFLGTDDRKQINSWCGVLLATEDKGGGNVLIPSVPTTPHPINGKFLILVARKQTTRPGRCISFVCIPIVHRNTILTGLCLFSCLPTQDRSFITPQ